MSQNNIYLNLCFSDYPNQLLAAFNCNSLLLGFGNNRPEKPGISYSAISLAGNPYRSIDYYCGSLLCMHFRSLYIFLTINNNWHRININQIFQVKNIRPLVCKLLCFDFDDNFKRQVMSKKFLESFKWHF